MEEDYDLSEFEEESPEFISEVKAFERTGFGDLRTKIGEGESGRRLRKLQERIGGEDEDFKERMEGAIQKYNDILKLSKFDLSKLRESYSYIPKPFYKNAVGLMFGYYLIKLDNNQKEIDKSKLKFLNDKILKKSEEFSPEDILRYARFWQKD